MQIQRVKKGAKREKLGACVLKQIRAAVERDAKKFDVSKSFVVAVALASVYEIPIDSYIDAQRRRRK